MLNDFFVYNKVWGIGFNDVWFVGAEGIILYYDGSVFIFVFFGIEWLLFMFLGREDGFIFIVVGGDLYGVVIEDDGDGFVDVIFELDLLLLCLVGVNYCGE